MKFSCACSCSISDDFFKQHTLPPENVGFAEVEKLDNKFVAEELLSIANLLVGE